MVYMVECGIPWNSPGQNTGMGSCSLLQGIFPTQGSNPGLLHCWQILYLLSHQGSPLDIIALFFVTPWTIYSPWNSSGQDTGVGSLSLLQGTFPTQRSNPGLLHCRQILYQLSHKGSPTILEWVAYPFSRGSSRPRNRTRSLIRPLLKCLPSFFSQKVPSYLCKSCSQ